MISFSLRCDGGHEFEAWFRNNADFDDQQERGLVACPHCGSKEVTKALMAPAVSTGRRKEKMALAMGEEQKKVLKHLKQLSEKLREGSEDVGQKFAEEARKIHFGETEARSIHGEASLDEARALAEEGVEFMPLPTFPDDVN
jgi:hypothetical protein